MRLWLENMLSDCADVVLAVGDWLYETFEPPLAALEAKMEQLFNATYLTRLFILCILIVMAVIG